MGTPTPSTIVVHDTHTIFIMKGSHHMQLLSNRHFFAVSEDESNTKEDTGKPIKNAPPGAKRC